MTIQFDTTATSRMPNGRGFNDDKEPPKFYLNLFVGKNQLGYITLDNHPDIVKFLQDNPDDGVERMLRNVTGTFREAGTRTITYDPSQW